ncbi:MAG: DUF3341 domain-containing protein [Cytophagales bacterium]|nr:DUF3341 domain-containing protein [Armatimonadota bacterium]
MHTEGNVLVQSPIYGVIAEFHDPDMLMSAAERAREAGYRRMDAYSPFPIHGLAETIGFEDARIPWLAFGGGIFGAVSGFMLLTWVSVIDYPWNVGGRPLLSWPQFIPITFECTILFAALTAFGSQFFLNGLPKPYDPIFNARNFDRASQDGFFLCIEAEDMKFDVEETQAFLRTLGADDVSPVER